MARMILFTKAILKQLPSIDKDRDAKEHFVHVKLFTPDSNWTWYVSAYDPGDDIAYGLVKGAELEYGYFSMQELRELRGPKPTRLYLERDTSFSKMPLQDVYDKVSAGKHV